MHRWIGFRRAATRAVIGLLIQILIPCATAAQTVIDPHMIEFIPSAANATILADGQPAVTQYAVDISSAGTAQLLQRVPLGRPPLQPDGMIRVDFTGGLTTPPAAGVQYVASVLTIGPLGTSVSTPSAPFTFSACSYALATPSASIGAAGGTGSINLTVAGGGWCGWNAVASAAWLQVTSGGSGLGSGAISYSVAANTTAAARTATLTIASLVYTVSQSAPTAQTVMVTTEPELQAAFAAVASNGTVIIAPGTYRLTSTLQVRGALSGVTIKGSTGTAADVLLEGAGMTTDGAATTAIWVTGTVVGLRISDLTIQRFSRNALLLDAATQAPVLSNLRLTDTGDVLIAVNPTATPNAADDGILENSVLEYTTTGASAAAGGIDLRGARRWTIRLNRFRNIRAPAGLSARPGVAASGGSSDTVVERNQFFNCQAGIALGLSDLVGGFDHSGGRIVNNFVYRAPLVPGGAAISVADSPNTAIIHNSVIVSQTYASPIEYRFADASNLLVGNNLVDGPIAARDNAAATLAGNVTTATSDFFVNAAAGDLHLLPTAFGAIDLGNILASAPADIGGDLRPMDAGPDVGADEVARFTAPPVVQLVKPLDRSIYRTGATIQLEATAQAGSGVAYVEFYANAVVIGRVSVAPYAPRWTVNRAGTYSIVAVAVDNAGRTATSQSVTVSVTKKGR
jgi:hypothetical protein